MKSLTILLFVYSLFSVSCVKKIESVNTLDTNIFDKDYKGEQWFVIDEAKTFFNSFGQLKVRFDLVIPKENFPELRPTKVDVAIRLNEGVYEYLSFYLNTKGNYELTKDYSTTPDGSYCLEIGLYDSDANEIVNPFRECITI